MELERETRIQEIGQEITVTVVEEVTRSLANATSVGKRKKLEEKNTAR